MASKSLGTLTLDLVAKTGGFVQGMDKAQRESQKWRRQVKKDIEDVGRKFKVVSAVAVAALGAITVETIRSAKEITRFSQVANTSTRDFQRYAAGAKLVGVEQEKLADILKDVTDKVGDFLITGGGPLADFFEKIAPQVGVTADQFRNLSGPQALELYVSSLEKANVSQSEMTFFMEAIASDATLLLPLLRNNADGFRRLGDEAERAGGVIGDDVLRSTDELAAISFILEQSLQGVRVEIGSQLIPVITQLAAIFVESTGDAADASDQYNILGNSLARIASVGVGANAAVQLLGKSLGGGAAVLKAAFTPGFDREEFANLQREIIADLDATAERYGGFINRLIDSGDSNSSTRQSAEARIRELSDLIAGVRGESQSAARGIATIGSELQDIEVQASKRELPQWIEESIELQDEYNSLVQSLRTDEEVILDQLRERLDLLGRVNAAYSNDPEAGQARSRSISAAFGGDSPRFAGLSPEIGGAFSEFNRINDARDELQEWYSEKLDLLREAREQELITQDEYNALELEKTKEHQEALAEIEKARQFVALSTAQETFGSLADIAKQFAGEQSAAYQTLFAFEKGVAIARSIIAIQTAIAQAATAGPFPANLAAMATVAAQTASIISNITSASISGQAHDGMMSVPKTGSYILEQGERVVAAETTKKLDATLDDVNRGGTGNIRIVNSFDSSEVVGNYMGSSAGEKIIMNAVRRNSRTIRSLAAA